MPRSRPTNNTDTLRVREYSGATAADPIQVSGLPATRINQPRVAYHDQTGAWLLSWTEGDNGRSVKYELLKQGSLAAVITSGTSRMSQTWSNTPVGQPALACPTSGTVAVANLRFDELPGATVAADSSGHGNNATITNNFYYAGNIVSGDNHAPGSDYAALFLGGDRLTMPRPVADDFTISFWMNSTQTESSGMEWPDSRQIVSNYNYYDANRTFGIGLNHGKIIFGVGNYVDSTLTGPFVADGKWHHIAATRDHFSGDLKIYVDGELKASRGYWLRSSLTSASQLGIGTDLAGRPGYVGLLDDLKIFGSVLGNEMINAVRTATEPAPYCVLGTSLSSGVPWSRLYLDRPDRRGAGPLMARSNLQIQIDADAPTSTISLADGAYVQGTPGGTQTLIVGGSASDPTSDIASVEVSVNGAAYTAAEGAASWAYALQAGEGVYTLRSRATDAAGNQQSTSTQSTFIIDATAPQVTASGLGATVVPRRTATGQWVVELKGTVADPTIGSRTGSGVATGSVEVLLAATSGRTAGNGWQQATQNGNTWSLVYALPEGVADPTGTYAVSVRAADTIGNRTGEPALGQLRLDAAGPSAALSLTDTQRQIITNALQFSGTVSDTTGIASVEAAFVPLNQVAAEAEAVLRLTMDEPAGSIWFNDATTHGNAARCLDSASCPTAGEAGRIDGALRFAQEAPGGQLISVDDAPSLDFGSTISFTLASWIKTSSTPRDRAVQASSERRVLHAVGQRPGSASDDLRLNHGDR